MKKENINIIKGIIAFFIYYIISQFSDLPLQLLKVDLTKLTITTTILYNYLVDTVIIFLIFLLFKNEIINAFKDFKKNKDIYFKKYFKLWFLLIGLVFISNLIILAITNGHTANNQEVINKLTTHSPYLMFGLAAIFGPVAEEFAFRLSFRNIFKNDELFILASGIIFAAFHVIPLYETWKDLVYLIPYAVPGIIFAYALKESKNIFVPIFIHMFHNGLLISLSILANILK